MHFRGSVSRARGLAHSKWKKNLRANSAVFKTRALPRALFSRARARWTRINTILECATGTEVERSSCRVLPKRRRKKEERKCCVGELDRDENNNLLGRGLTADARWTPRYYSTFCLRNEKIGKLRAKCAQKKELPLFESVARENYFVRFQSVGNTTHDEIRFFTENRNDPFNRIDGESVLLCTPLCATVSFFVLFRISQYSK